MSKKWKYMLNLLFIGCEDNWIKFNGRCYRKGTWAEAKFTVISFNYSAF